jgi:hypothetical protein
MPADGIPARLAVEVFLHQLVKITAFHGGITIQ